MVYLRYGRGICEQLSYLRHSALSWVKITYELSRFGTSFRAGVRIPARIS